MWQSTHTRLPCWLVCSMVSGVLEQVWPLFVLAACFGAYKVYTSMQKNKGKRAPIVRKQNST